MKKKMTRKLADTISAAIKPINNVIENLTCGGCGVFACYFAEKMLSAGFEAAVVELTSPTSYRDAHTKEDLQQNNINMHKAAMSHANPDDLDVFVDSHFVVKIEEYYFDCSGYHCVTDNKKDVLRYHYGNRWILGEVSEPDLEYISIENRGDLWNDMYSTEQNPQVKEFIDKALTGLL